MPNIPLSLITTKVEGAACWSLKTLDCGAVGASYTETGCVWHSVRRTEDINAKVITLKFIIIRPLLNM